MRFLILLLNILLVPCLGEARNYSFTRLDNSNGLSSNQIENIFKDTRGFMWIATNSGLNRYDGYNFKVYYPDDSDPHSVPVNMIKRIYEDGSGRMWFKYKDKDYVAYDFLSDRFEHNVDSILSLHGLPSAPDIIETDDRGNLCVVKQRDGVYIHDFSLAQTTVYPLEGNEIRDLSARDGNFIIILRNGTLQSVEISTGRVLYEDDFFCNYPGSGVVEQCLFLDGDGDVWIYPAIGELGTAFFSPRQGKWTFIYDSGSGQDVFVRSITQDNEGYVWIATDHSGVHIFDKHTGNITTLSHDIFDDNSLSQNSIITLYCADDGIVWAGSYKYGISCYHPDMFKFTRSAVFSSLINRLGNVDCNSMCKDREGNLWIGTDGSGLIRYNESTGRYRIFRHDPRDPASLSSDVVISVFTDSRGDVWIGTFLSGLNRYSGQDRFIRYQPEEGNPNSLSNRSVYDITEDTAGNLWVGTLGGGICVLDTSRKKFTRFNTANTPGIRSNYFISLSKAPEDRLYLCNSNGITFVDMAQEIFRPYFPGDPETVSFAGMTVNKVMEDSRGLVWIATDQCIVVYDPFLDTRTTLTRREGLPADEVLSLVEDDHGNIWAGTRYGLACIQFDNEVTGNRFAIRYFDYKDGLPGNACNHNALYKDDRGRIYMGTTKGFVSFTPDSITFNRTVPSPAFTDLLLAGEPVRPGRKTRGRSLIDQDISTLDRIVLRHNQTNITIRFSALNYIHPEKNLYRYRLEGIDRDWIEDISGMGQVSYSNLNPEKYRFVLYASNNDAVWQEEPLVMNIEVRPPFWFSTVAIVFYTLVVVALLWWYLHYRLRKQKNTFEQKRVILEADKQHELDELKLRFFTNVSHEFKTPLTLVITPIEKMMQDPSLAAHHSLLAMMHRNAKSLLTMVNEILDFRKLDLNKVSFKPGRGDIVEFIREICQSFSELSADSGIKLTFTTYMESLKMDFDPDIVNKVVSNLLSNAFKYTREGNVDVSLGIVEFVEEASSRYLSIKVTDTGIGIAREHLDKIFDRFYRIDDTPVRFQTGTGVGLNLIAEFVKLHKGDIKVKSEPGKGSTFTVILPILTDTVQIVPDMASPAPQPEPMVPGVAGESGSRVPSDLPVQPQQPARNPRMPLLLIMDDNDDFREFTSGLLKDMYRIETAPDGQTGLELMLRELPDLILCDIMMPGMDGYEFCRRVKADIRTSHVPIILLTAKSSEENRYLGIEAGADDYILKPFDIAMLTLRISKIIERQKRNHRNFKNKVEISTGSIEITSMDEKFVARAVAIVEKNLGNPDFLVESLCREMGMSRVYFYKKILTLTDKTPSEFIRFIRLKRAAELLEKSQLFVNEVAYQVGFNDAKYFRKYFKDEFGMTPNEYKKKFTDMQRNESPPFC